MLGGIPHLSEAYAETGSLFVSSLSTVGRTLVAIFVAPAVAALGVTIVESSADGSLVLAPLYFVATYVIAILPGSFVILTLKNLELTRLWQFVVSGFFVAAVCTLGLVLVLFSHQAQSASLYVQKFLELVEYLAIGPVVGAITWLIMEARFGSRSEPS